jgi:hypothetical protein
MTNKDFRSLAVNVILFFIGAVILFLDLTVWRP